jgi:hypothetical protein
MTPQQQTMAQTAINSITYDGPDNRGQVVQQVQDNFPYADVGFVCCILLAYWLVFWIIDKMNTGQIEKQ